MYAGRPPPQEILVSDNINPIAKEPRYAESIQRWESFWSLEDIGRPLWMIPRLSWLLFKLFLYRMWQKYVIRDFHPLVLFYAFGFVLLLIDIPLSIRLLARWIETGRVLPINALTVAFFTLMSFQSILFAMLFDMEANRELKAH